MKIEADISQWPGLQDAINAGYEVIAFKIPKKGDMFIGADGCIGTKQCTIWRREEFRPILRLKPIKSTDIIDALRHNLTVNRIDISGDEYTIYAKDNRHGKSNG